MTLIVLLASAGVIGALFHYFCKVQTLTKEKKQLEEEHTYVVDLLRELSEKDTAFTTIIIGLEEQISHYEEKYPEEGQGRELSDILGIE